MFYTYNQNNSGGKFEINNDIKHYVIIEADNCEEANRIAESVGIYFDGVEEEIDCPCCGNRWSRADESDGYQEPSIYGTKISDYKGFPCWNTYIVYYKDGHTDKGEFSTREGY